MVGSRSGRFSLLVATAAAALAVACSWQSQGVSAAGFNYTEATVYYNAAQDAFTLTVGVLDLKNGIVAATFNDSMNIDGWGTLRIEQTDRLVNHDSLKAFGTGFIEGALTADRIWQAHVNLNARWGFNDTAGYPPYLIEFFEEQYGFMRNSTQQNATDPYWQYLSLLMDQFDGLGHGYNMYADSDKRLTPLQLYIMNSAGDMEDLVGGLLVKQGLPYYLGMTRDRMVAVGMDPDNPQPPAEDAFPWDKIMQDCSVLIKVLPGFEELLMAHATWRDFGQLIRLYKFYDFTYDMAGLQSTTLSFSSSPSFLSSKDDFYVLDSGMVVMETTNSILDQTLYQKLSPQTVLCWQRVMASNALAGTPQHWTEIFARYNSGTYNNQWQVVQMGNFEQFFELPPGTFWIIEQIPGTTAAQDVTGFLNQNGYWPSYNIPYSPMIYNLSGYPAYFAKYGNQFSYTENPRATIFRRDHNNVVDLESMQTIMRYNEYQTDPLSLGDPANAIASRYDLRPSGGSAFGAIDGKITSVELALEYLGCIAINGPTAQTQPPFSWSTSPFAANTTHLGHPDTFDFPWVLMLI
ncbi:mannose-6-phosphate protein p76 [Capsaspora owczarzaki ATCC 30864]|uniref:Phospholipase B-like n=1 Tax=Capsaspora owczarzaki (strain ATCC 30864) TaxID=595528 RepID=A0A0D2VSE2_CAPO3|nr:mannose-6-phosphate protein p76 [Capsaspora owczarzaki ATCC 30864]KJE93997.1 mannose-6-phosphate protein p76 [Capsaspora owczarzaki ATCC 30864]|eukprot:XP_004347450.1 mannose-6-phosphate protein p76 [Capsaspora owczarzaki ATCC 30864]